VVITIFIPIAFNNGRNVLIQGIIQKDFRMDELICAIYSSYSCYVR